MSALTHRLFIKDLEFYAYHGFSDEEQAIGHRYVMQLELRVGGNSSVTDQLTDTVDYGAVADLAVRTATESKHRLMEHVCHRVGTVLIQDFPLVKILTVTIAKKCPPIPHIAAEAGISMTFSQGEQDASGSVE